MHSIFDVRIRVFSNNCRHYTTNNFERLIEEKKSLKIISIIMTPIFKKIDIYIGLTGFLETIVPEVMFDTNGRILEGLVIIEEICTKLNFGRYISLDWRDHCKLEAVYTANHKDSIIELKKEDPKAKAK